MIRWLPDYAIGVQDVDAEHQRLFALAGKLHQSISAGQDREILDAILQDLIDYTCYHFTNEEELMERIGYPHVEEHRQEHQALRFQVLARQAASPAEVLQFVTDWMKCHTTTTDRRIGTYMRKHGLA